MLGYIEKFKLSTFCVAGAKVLRKGILKLNVEKK